MGLQPMSSGSAELSAADRRHLAFNRDGQPVLRDFAETELCSRLGTSQCVKNYKNFFTDVYFQDSPVDWVN
jgi:hypothetical protein